MLTRLILALAALAAGPAFAGQSATLCITELPGGDLPLQIEEVESEDVTMKADVTDHAHIDPSLMPETIHVAVNAWAPAFGACDAKMQITVEPGEEIGLAPWQDVEVALEVTEHFGEDPS